MQIQSLINLKLQFNNLFINRFHIHFLIVNFILALCFGLLFNLNIIKADSLSINNLNLKGAVLQNEENIDSLYSIINITLKYAKNDENRIQLLNELAKQYEFKNIQSTVLIYRKALEIAEKSKDNKLIIKSVIDLSYYEIISKNYPKALELLNRAEILSKSENDYKLNAKIYNYFGLLSYHTKNYENAIEFYNIAIEVRYKNNDSLDIDLYISNVGLAYKNLGEFNKAIQNFTISYNIAKNNNDLLREAENCRYIAETYFQQNNFQKCLSFYNMAKDLYLELKNDDKTANIMIDLGYVLFKFADYYKAIAHLKKGIELADKVNNNSLKKQGYNYLHKVYYKTGDFRKAYEMLIKYAEINENISLIDLNKTISEMQIKLDFDKKTTVQKTKDDNNFTLYILIGIILILIFVLIYLLFILQKSKKIHEKLNYIED